MASTSSTAAASASSSSSSSSSSTAPTASARAAVPQVAQEAVLVASGEMPANSVPVRGYEFNEGVDYGRLMASLATSGFQATNVGLAIAEINRMRQWRLSDVPVAADEDEAMRSMEARSQVQCTIYLGYTSNLISSGLRETIRFLVQHKMVDVLVTTAGGIEEDLIKCMAQTYLGDFSMPGAELRRQGINRIGNLLVPNANYCKFEDWVMPVLDALLEQQKTEGVIHSPSSIIDRLGKEIAHEDSVLYWAHKNKIPVFCPALTDGSIGDMIYFHSYRNPGLVVDIAQDIRKINSTAVHARQTGMIVLGGGVIKHHICNANLMRNGANFAVYINTAQEFDGSDAGARPDEAVSWGKIRMDAKPVKVYADATVVFPLIVAETFAKDFRPTQPGAAAQRESKH